MPDIRTVLTELLHQLDISDQYAAQENPSRMPTVWQIQNSLLRDKAKEAVTSATSSVS